MNVALCISGHLRTVDKCYDSHYNNILKNKIKTMNLLEQWGMLGTGSDFRLETLKNITWGENSRSTRLNASSSRSVKMTSLRRK